MSEGQQFLWEDSNEFINIQALSVSSEQYNCDCGMADDETKLKLIEILNSLAAFPISADCVCIILQSLYMSRVK